jgi:hypothetical protein
VELFFLCHTFKLTAEVREFDWSDKLFGQSSEMTLIFLAIASVNLDIDGDHFE